jgi:RNA polymerase sigma-70 factor (ECF subfamily)
VRGFAVTGSWPRDQWGALTDSSTDARLAHLLADSDWLRGLAYALARDPDGADDLAQQTWLAALEHPPRESADLERLRGWIATVARNAWRRSSRAELHRVAREREAARGEALESNADAIAGVEQQLELQRRIAEVLLALPEPYRSAVTLRYLDGCEPRVLAARLGISEANARQRVSRGLALLRMRLDAGSPGGREAWLASCVCVLRRAAPSSVTTATVAGVVVMGVKLKFVAVLVALIALSVAWIRLQPSDPARPISTVALVPEAVAGLRAGPTEAPETRIDVGARREVLPAVPASAVQVAARPIDRERELTGIVLDPSDHPVAGATLTLWRDEESGYDIPLVDQDSLQRAALTRAETQTDADGEFRIALEPGQPHELEVRVDRYPPLHYGDRYAGERMTVRLCRPAELHLRVLRAGDGMPVADALVRLRPKRDGALGSRGVLDLGRTDDQGRTHSNWLSGGEFVAAILPPLEVSTRIGVSLVAGERLERDVYIELGDTVRGTVRDAASGSPLAGAELSDSWTFERTVKTDARGEYTLPGLCSNCTQVYARAAGHELAWKEAREWPSRRIQGPVDFALASGLRVRGRVVDARGAPLQGVQASIGVSARAVGAPFDDVTFASGRSAADGSFELVDVRRTGACAVHLRDPGYATAVYDLAPPTSDQVVLEAGTFTLLPGLLLRGVVVDERARPVPDWPVDLRGWNADRARYSQAATQGLDPYVGARHARTDDLGRFSFAELSAGTYKLEAKCPRQDGGASQQVELGPAGQHEPLQLVLKGGLAIAGVALDPAGLPLHGFYIALHPEFEANAAERQRLNHHGLVDRAGRFRFEGLIAGSYRVVLEPNLVRPEDQEQRAFTPVVVGGIAAGREDLVLRPRLAGAIRGRVVGPDGRPRVNVAIHARDASGAVIESATSGAAGEFVLRVALGETYDLSGAPPVPSQRYFVGFEGDPDPQTHARLPNVAPNGVDVELRLP